MAEGSTIKSILNNLNEKNGLIFMDYNTLACSEYVLGISGKVVPLMVDFKDQIREKKTNEVPRIAWVGRLDSFKIHILEYIIRDMSKRKNTSFHIIGSGKAEKRIRALANRLNFNITFHGFVEPSKLPDLIQTMDVVFAMGTSALQAGHLGVATVLVDYSEKRIKEDSYQFSWLCDQVVIGVGQDINMPYFRRSTSLRGSDDFKTIGSQCHDYVEKYHGESANKKLIEALHTSTAPLSLVHEIKFIKPIQKTLYIRLSKIRDKILKMRSQYSYSFFEKVIDYFYPVVI